MQAILVRNNVIAVDTLTIELPSQRSQTAFNLKRWGELLADPAMRKFEGRIETDRHGHVLMSPPPAASHGSYQSRITVLLDRLLPLGRVVTECPISTADGVRAADVAWASPECVQELGDLIVFPRAPEICVEVISPDDTAAEMREKAALYFDAGAKEVWHCSRLGRMTFLVEPVATPVAASRLCPDFPTQVELK